MAKILTPIIRNYSCFKNWNWVRLDANRVQLWNTTCCDQCTQFEGLVLHDMVIYETNDLALKLSGLFSPPGAQKLSREYLNKVRAHIPYVGGPTLCLHHYQIWLKGEAA